MPIPLRDDFNAAKLRALAKKTKDGAASVPPGGVGGDL
jgi:hypothetical protein